ncbi:hypothetical protein [Treponema sp.]|uniref:hypothetical protein n=1 Tax=Treponema sp. TaxID=166 RepID=UPI00298D7458|nr:hypothetical protein [Treponema sp.]MCR5613944.1 DUF1635 domain-containing protein [Treponema sp.]
MTLTKKVKIFSLCVATAIFTASLFAQNADTEKLVKPEKPYDKDAPYVMSSWGFSWSRVTRLQLQTTRSNFVWQDDMLGLFYAAHTGNLPVNIYGKITVMYPYHYEFNKVEQKAKQTILYAADLTAGPIWTIPLWEIAKLDLAPVVHLRYQLSDKYHHFDLGFGVFASFEFPITKTFTVLLNGGFTYDLGNLGTNSRMQPYNHVWTYNADLGFRISKRGKNSFSYVKTKSELEEAKLKAQERKEESARKREQKKQEALLKKQERAKAKAQYKEDMAEYKRKKAEQKKK